MAVCYHEQHLNSIKKLIQKKSFNSYFHKVIGAPQLDEDRLLMMFISLEDTNLSNSKRDSYIAAAMLVQLALDTHEKVAYPDALMKERQLNVLAGDYFSGMYYSVLAQLESVELISTLASAIKTVNEHKITLNQNDGITFNMVMHSYKEVEKVVLEQFCLHFQSTRYIGIFNEFLFLKKLVAEYESFHSGKQGLFFDMLKKNLFLTKQIFLLQNFRVRILND